MIDAGVDASPRRPTIGSLFSGIGGFDLGFAWAGFDVKWQCESSEFCRRALAKFWPDVPCYPDVAQLGRADAAGRPAVVPARVDVLVGGFPCQDVSNAGLCAGLDGRDSRLWFEFDRCVGLVRPDLVVVENVAALLIRGFGDVLGGLAARGYDAEWTCIRACDADVGAGHERDRLFVIAVRSDRAVVANAAIARLQGDFAKSLDRPVYRGVARSSRFPALPGTQQEPWEPSRVWTLADAVGPRRRGPRDDDDRQIARRNDAHGRRPRTSGRRARRADRIDPAQSAMGARAHGIPVDVARWRRAALQAIGNAVVPHVGYVVACRAREILYQLERPDDAIMLD